MAAVEPAPEEQKRGEKRKTPMLKKIQKSLGWKPEELKEIKFSENNTAKYVAVKKEEDMGRIESLLLDEWQLPLPKLIISVTGGADRSQVSPSMQRAFRRGLMNAARSTGAWLVTGGTESGVMKQVGEAARAQRLTSGDDKKIPLIGISSEQEVDISGYCKKEPDGSTKNKAKLDRNHTHFLLVRSDSVEKAEHFKEAIDFRVAFEQKVTKRPKRKGQSNVPIVLIMFEGGKDTLGTVSEALKNDTPTVIIKGSGRAADILAQAYEEAAAKGWQNPSDKSISDMCKENNIQEEKVSMCVQYVKECLKRRQRLTVFELTNESSVYDVDRAILEALLKAKSSAKKQLGLAIIWDRFSIAHDEIDTQNLKEKDLKKLTKLALQYGRAEFLDMFLDLGADLELLTEKNLAKLFLEFETSRHSVLVQDICNSLKAIQAKLKTGEDKKKESEEFRGVLHKQLLKINGLHVFEKDAPKERNYLLWAVLMNRMDLADIFWREGKEKTLAALVVCMTLRALAECHSEFDSELKDSFQRQAEEWGRRAGELLVRCHQVEEGRARQLLVLESPAWGHTSCLLTVLLSHNKRFAALHPCRTLRRLVWEGKWPPPPEQQKRGKSMLCARCTSKVSCSDHKENKENYEQHERIRISPRAIFYLHWITYVLFLGLYSYMVLVELGTYFTWVEGVITTWVVAIAVDAGVQFRRAMERPLGSRWDRVRNHLASPWPILDLVSILIFAMGLFLWVPGPGPVWEAGRVLLALDLLVFFLRSLYHLTLSRYFGPKLVMFGNMLLDLAFLSVILLVFVFGYAIASEAILYPNNPPSFRLLYSVPRKAFWQLFGEFFLEDIEGSSPCTNDSALYADGSELRCPSSYGSYVVPILMAVYILITNLLLLNLIIAMFTHTFTRVQEETEQLWHFLRLRGVYELTLRSPLPPPLSLLYHAYWIVSGQLWRGSTSPNPFKLELEKEREDLIEWEDAVADMLFPPQQHSARPAPGARDRVHIAAVTANSSEA